jgi:hypothetical protein
MEEEMVMSSELAKGQYFRWQSDIYIVMSDWPDTSETCPDTIQVTRMAGLWTKKANPWLSEDTWIPCTLNTKNALIEKFNSYAEVTPVKFSIIARVEEIT